MGVGMGCSTILTQLIIVEQARETDNYSPRSSWVDRLQDITRGVLVFEPNNLGF